MHNYKYYKIKKMTSKVITLTFGDMAENHVGMEQMVDEGEGYNLEMIRDKMENLGIKSTIIDLSRNAYILVIKNPLPILLDDKEANIKMFNEQLKLNFDKKAFMYGRVVNKHARWNLILVIQIMKMEKEQLLVMIKYL